MLRGYRGAFPWPLLLLHQSAWAVLRVSVPASPIRALPFANLSLPCNFSDPSRAISLNVLAVTWKKNHQTVARYSDKFTSIRPGAEISKERLLSGDASLLLSGLQDSDSGLYTCLVVFTPEKDEGSFQLKLEAEPQIALGSTKMQLAKRGTLTCTVSGFYPRDVSVEWLRDGEVVKGPQTSIQPDSRNGLYKASSIWEFTPSTAHENANFSCQVRHQSLEGSRRENFQLQLHALPVLQIVTVVPNKTLEMLACLVSGFYPRDIQVHWLRNGVLQSPAASEPQMLPNGTFSMESIIRPHETDVKVLYVCQVRHKEWDAPMELTAHWQPKEEGDGVPCPTPQHPQISREGLDEPHSCSPTPVPTSPTSAIGTAAAFWPWLVLGLGLVLCAAGGIMMYISFKKGKNKSYPDTKSMGHQNRESAEPMWKPERDNVAVSTTTPM